jgi:hypothetical protein
MGNKPQEWENCIVLFVYRKGDIRKVENYRGISLLGASCAMYSKSSNEKLEVRPEKFLSE